MTGWGGQIADEDVHHYLADHLRELADMASRAGKAEAAALISLAVMSIDGTFTENIDAAE